jgi:hypothetical protein
MEFGLVFSVFVVLVVLGYYAAMKKHPTDPHQDFLFDLTRRCLPQASDGEIHRHLGETGAGEKENLPASSEEPVQVGFR